MRKIKLAGIRRSGNHAILGWIAERLPEGKTFFVNDVKLDRDYSEKRKSDDLPTKRTSPRRKAALLLTSYEDRSLALVNKHEPFVDVVYTEEKKIIVLRDAFNTFASRLKYRKNGKYFKEDDQSSGPPKASELWLEYAKEYAGVTKSLKGSVVMINYNSWFADPDYRVLLAKSLRLDPSPAPFERVPGYGFGSSFSNRSKDGKASKMLVLNRWKTFSKDPSYINYFNEEIIELSKEIFPEVQGPFD